MRASKLAQVKEQLQNLVKLVTELEANENDTPFTFPGELPHRVIHFKDNPFDRAISDRRQQFEDLKREHERLRVRLELIQSRNEGDITIRIDDVLAKAHQVDELTRTVNQLKARQEKILTSFGKISQDFRQACELLIGYRIDANRGSIYKLTHVYHGLEDWLTFKIERNGDIKLIEGSSTKKLSEYITTYLKTAHSYPAFLAAITLQLFKSSQHHQTIDMSVNMSTTMQPQTMLLSETMRKTRPVVSTFGHPIAAKPDDLASIDLAASGSRVGLSTLSCNRSTVSMSASNGNNDSTMSSSANTTVLEVGAKATKLSGSEMIDRAKQVEELTRKVAELKEHEDKIVVSFRRTSREFKEVCYLLTGYRVEALKDGVFRLSSMYAEHEDDKLIFKIEDGEVQLLENKYAKRVSHFIQTYLEEADSFPAFLAAITLDLFKLSTQSVDMSMTMSTTMLPS